MEFLRNELKSIVNTLNKEDLDKRFQEIAETLMTNYAIENSKGVIYFLNEIEFYYYDSLYDDKRSGNGKTRITYERTAPAGRTARRREPAGSAPCRRWSGRRGD